MSPDNLPEVRKGNENAIKLTTGSASYMEASQQGPKAAIELSDTLRKKVLEVAQCVLEHPEGGARTATEIKLVYSSMTSKADILREQYGERCVKPLMEMMVEAARKVTTPVRDANGVVRGKLTLPDRVVKEPGGVVRREPRRLGPGGQLALQWRDYFTPSLQDIEMATRAAGAAKQLGLVDAEHAAKKVAQYYDVEDVPAMLEKIKQEEKQRQDEIAAQSLAGFGMGGGMPEMPQGEPEQEIDLTH